MTSATVWTLQTKIALLTLGLLTSGCVTSGSSETEAAICRELRPIPTMEAADTERTKVEGADFGARFKAVCG
jgi:hypothetical protein